jgi:MinD-like ATPase involved in chromosome partitioning or flagellar assembly
MIQTAKDSREYDFIVVDIEAGYSENKMELLQMADKVLMVCLQDKVSVQKMEYLLRNIDLRDREKYLFICNKYDETKQNAYLESEMQARFTMSEYVERLNGELTEVRQVSALKGIQKLAYMFI